MSEIGQLQEIKALVDKENPKQFEDDLDVDKEEQIPEIHGPRISEQIHIELTETEN
jgi:hypothetical protein